MKIPSRLPTRAIVGMILLVLGISLLLVLLPKPPLDLSKEEAPFPSISMPPQAVYGMGYMDGGSVGVLIVDHVGARHELTFPVDYDGIVNAYPTAYWGNMNDPKKIALKDPARAKEIAIRLLGEFGKEKIYPEVEVSDFTARARRALSSSPYDVAFRGYKKLRGIF